MGKNKAKKAAAKGQKGKTGDPKGQKSEGKSLKSAVLSLGGDEKDLELIENFDGEDDKEELEDDSNGRAKI